MGARRRSSRNRPPMPAATPPVGLSHRLLEQVHVCMADDTSTSRGTLKPGRRHPTRPSFPAPPAASPLFLLPSELPTQQPGGLSLPFSSLTLLPLPPLARPRGGTLRGACNQAGPVAQRGTHTQLWGGLSDPRIPLPAPFPLLLLLAVPCLRLPLRLLAFSPPPAPHLVLDPFRLRHACLHGMKLCWAESCHCGQAGSSCFRPFTPTHM